MDCTTKLLTLPTRVETLKSRVRCGARSLNLLEGSVLCATSSAR